MRLIGASTNRAEASLQGKHSLIVFETNSVSLFQRAAPAICVPPFSLSRISSLLFSLGFYTLFTPRTVAIGSLLVGVELREVSPFLTFCANSGTHT